MHDFHYRNQELYCEEVPVREIAQKVGTPFYLYSHRTLLNHFEAFRTAFSGIPHLVAFAMKANANLTILRLFAKAGGGADIVSAGELYRALTAGVPPERIVFAGVGKTPKELAYALSSDILMFNVESEQELLALNEAAGWAGRIARIALRVNPDVDPKTHPYISTGLKKSKFGIWIEKALKGYQIASKLPHLEVVGLHMHIGSQLTTISPYVAALKRLIPLVERLRSHGIVIRYLNMGGGLGIVYTDENPPPPAALARAVAPLIRKLGVTLILEPGRSLVGNAGILVTKALYTKEAEKKHFLIVDAAMTDLIRPSLYGAYHQILPVVKKQRKKLKMDVVGPVCESGDFLAKDRLMPRVEPGEHLAVLSAGAYGFTMSSNYNARPRAEEVLVHGKEFHTIRRRETFEDLVRGESIPEFLK
jgi:diaminopimelate decarboxylase